MTRLKSCSIIASIVFVIVACESKPSEKEIKAKLLTEYGCADKAEVKEMKILSTSETKGTDIKHVYKYTVSGEIEWPQGCNEGAKQTAPGSRETFEKDVVLTDTGDGWK